MDTVLLDATALPCAGGRIRKAIRLAERHDTPFRHWLPAAVLPDSMAHALARLPLAPRIGVHPKHNPQRLAPVTDLHVAHCQARLLGRRD